MNKKYDNLVGKTPEQITHYFGNRKPTVNEAIWAYELQSNWYGRKKCCTCFLKTILFPSLFLNIRIPKRYKII